MLSGLRARVTHAPKFHAAAFKAGCRSRPDAGIAGELLAWIRSTGKKRNLSSPCAERFTNSKICALSLASIHLVVDSPLQEVEIITLVGTGRPLPGCNQRPEHNDRLIGAQL